MVYMRGRVKEEVGKPPKRSVISSRITNYVSIMKRWELIYLVMFNFQL